MKSIALYTTPAQFPWYRAATPLTLTLPPRGINDEESRKKFKFSYKYAIYSGGVFSRWEQPSDGPDPDDGDVTMSEGSSATAGTTGSSSRSDYHEIALHHMQHGETYVVSNVLGLNFIPADIDHVFVKATGPSYTQAATLHNPANSTDGMSIVNIMGRGGTSTSSGSMNSTPVSNIRKKGVGFAPPPPPYHQKANQTKNSVHLNSTDGLVVVSVFLPVIVKRSDEGAWSAGKFSICVALVVRSPFLSVF
jgi:hypothetical protein